MSETKFTPGPWHRNIPPARKYPTIWAGRNTHIAAVVAGAPRGSGNGEDMSDGEIEANAHLIAAAPDLYHELDMQVRNCPVCKGEGMAVDVLDLIQSEPPHDKKPCTRCASSRAALSKARGESA